MRERAASEPMKATLNPHFVGQGQFLSLFRIYPRPLIQ